MPTVAPFCSVGELALLFAGDEITEGYPTFELALAICEQVEPHALRALYFAVYGLSEADPLPDLEERAKVALYDAFTFWKQQSRLAAA